MQLLIVTGKSGAGKSCAMNALEDIGYFCMDNIPPQLITKVAEICSHSDEKFNKIAIVTDIRGGSMFSELFDCLETLKSKSINYQILFITADNSELTRRYRETRRKHPLSEQSSLPVDKLVEMESNILTPVLQHADYIIDTTYTRPAQLKSRISELFTDNKLSGTLKIHCMSFGFKYGTPREADIMFDARCFPNPYYIEELKHQTGLDEPVRDFVLKSVDVQGFLDRVFSLLDFLVPLYIKEGKSQLVVAIGCTGGKHRSVVTTQMLYEHLKEHKFSVSVDHRDISK